MDMINGHYLGDRKASRDPRVFKYANKGFGIRILPSYMASLSTYPTAVQTKQIARGQPLFPPPLSLPTMADKSRKWTSQVLRKFIELGHKTTPFYSTYGAHENARKYPPIKSALPVFSHAMLGSNMQRSSEPLGRSCLTGFSLFMRHVALWEEEVKGTIFIHDELFAENTYGEGLANIAYDDTPQYSWDHNFNITDFCRHIDEFNAKDAKGFLDSVNYTFAVKMATQFQVKRLTYGTSVDEVLSPEKDLRIMLVLSEKLVDFANAIILKAMKEAGFAEQQAPLKIVHNGNVEQGFRRTQHCLVAWTLDKRLNWQMMDRRIDEVREMLWAYHRANEHMQPEDDEKMLLVMAQISKRVIRIKVEEELEAFVIWVGRKPYHRSPIINAHFLLEDFGGNSPDGGQQTSYQDGGDDDGPGDSDENSDEDEDEG